MIKKYWRWLLILLPVATFLAARFDAPLYSTPVAQVTRVTASASQTETDSNSNEDRLITQRVQARLLNGPGGTIALTNTYTASQALDFPLRVGSQIFVTKIHGQYQLKDDKRDAILLTVAMCLIVLMILVLRRHFWVTLASIVINTAIFLLVVHVDISNQSINAWLIFSGLAIVFTLVTAAFIVGVNRLMLIISGATVAATVLAVALGYAILSLTGYNGVHLETVKYVTQAPQLLFYVQIVVGALGAVLDVAGDIAVSVYPQAIGRRDKFRNGMAVGRAVLGPLIGVLMMIFVAGTFAEAVLWLRNGNAVGQTIEWVMGLGLAQSLISAFGIVLAVPLTSGAMAFVKQVDA
ncbi:YibE/F family protein [Lacticaseibacillus brantae]|uniref:Membrane protein n=1 Tax=Lacticaseibacillus brantae DSM 23927 TaxID=1423727 RepID=A0A0R2B675_9LACO|nr:YibE/F family protein [Lacticaseibacillus brantae]KRM71574.1 membrane protein [Lacticaseibacillus brantae DSM 23927]